VRAGGIYAAFAEEQQMARELEEIDVSSLPPPPVSASGKAVAS
jgi:hypothetical protein